jgi:hypothetical protein
MRKTGKKRRHRLAIALDERVAAWARARAAERGATLSRFVTDIIKDELRRSQAYQKAMRAALAEKPLGFKKPFLKREELYAERLRRRR